MYRRNVQIAATRRVVVNAMTAYRLLDMQKSWTHFLESAKGLKARGTELPKQEGEHKTRYAPNLDEGNV